MKIIGFRKSEQPKHDILPILLKAISELTIPNSFTKVYYQEYDKLYMKRVLYFFLSTYFYRKYTKTTRVRALN